MRKILIGHTSVGSSRTNNGNLHRVDFLHLNIILSLGTNKNTCEGLEMTGYSPARS